MGRQRLFRIGKWSLILFLASSLMLPLLGENIIAKGNMVPSDQQIIKDIKKVSPNKLHPRLILTNADQKLLLSNRNKDKNIQRYYAQLIKEADQLIWTPPAKYGLSDGIRLESSTVAAKRIPLLSLAYRMTGQKKYATRALEEMRVVAGYPDWNPDHFLDTAELAIGMSVGLDWLYHYITPKERNYFANVIYSKAIVPANKVYNSKRTSWKDQPHNWNTVCNSGIGIAALTIMDELPLQQQKLTSKAMQNSISSIKLSLQQFNVDGGFSEGPSYWNYATLYLAYYLSALDDAVKTDYGLSKVGGTAENDYFPFYTTGPTGAFNLGDGTAENVSSSPQLLYFASKFKHPMTAYFAIQTNHPFNLLWYTPTVAAVTTSEKIKTQPLDRFFSAPETSIATMRTSWDKNGVFVGLHGGSNQSVHGDLDIGDFVVDAKGVRWATNLGADNYNSPGYFDYASGRWQYYRKRAEGQNTLVINSSKDADQNILARGEIFENVSTKAYSYSIVDMSEAYQKTATNALRGIALNKVASEVVIQDEIQLREPSDVFWFMHTQAAMTLSSDKRVATLNQSGKRITARVLHPLNAQFSIMDAKPLPTSPNPAKQQLNSNSKKLTLKVRGNHDLKIVVVLSTEERQVIKETNALLQWSFSGPSNYLGSTSK